MTSCFGARAHLRLLCLLAAGLLIPVLASIAQTPAASPQPPAPATPPPTPATTPPPAPTVPAVPIATPQPAATPTIPGQCYALLIGGISAQDPYGKWYADWLPRFQTYLTQRAHLPAANVAALCGKDATFDAVTAAFAKFAQRAKPQDQLILFIVGHGESKDAGATLELAGVDPTAQQIAALLNAFPAKNQVVLNLSASSGDFLKVLSAPGRVNIAATSPTELEEPVFAEFFLRGLESKRVNAAKSDAVNLLDIYNWTTQQTAFWIARWSLTSDPKDTDSSTWKASGKETVEVFEKLYSGVPNRKLDPASNRNAADVPVDLIPPGGQVTEDWAARRVIDEHAMLEDCGQGIGVSEIGDKGLQPILGQKPGDPGYLAAHTVLGQAGTLTP